jgi:phage terminase large subunit GpA-like protein
VVAWECRHNEDEISAIQHAMNLKLYDEAAFFAEYQNEPLEEGHNADVLTANQIAAKVNGLDRRAVPEDASRIVAFIDVQKKLLPYVVMAFADDFTGYVIDYGTWPDQRRNYFTLRDARISLATRFPRAGLEGSIYGGLEALTSEILGREWQRDDGAHLKIERCFIDANWGESTEIVYQFCRRSPHAAVLTPTHGKYVGASSKPFSEYQRKRGDQMGHYWRMPAVKGRREVRYLIYDANYWKSCGHARLAMAMGDRGGISLLGRTGTDHRLFAEHLTAEYPVKTAGRGRTVDEWKERPNRENHWFDCYVGCCVAACCQGSRLPEWSATAGGTRKRKRVTWAEMQARRWAR